MKYLRIVESIFWISVIGFCHVQAAAHSNGDPDNESSNKAPNNADDETTDPFLAACIIMRNDPAVSCILGHFRKFYSSVESKPDVISDVRKAVGFTEENLGNINEILTTKDMLNLTQVIQTWIVHALGMRLTHDSLEFICKEVIKLEGGLRNDKTCDIGQIRSDWVRNESDQLCLILTGETGNTNPTFPNRYLPGVVRLVDTDGHGHLNGIYIVQSSCFTEKQLPNTDFKCVP